MVVRKLCIFVWCIGTLYKMTNYSDISRYYECYEWHYYKRVFLEIIIQIHVITMRRKYEWKFNITGKNKSYYRYLNLAGDQKSSFPPLYVLVWVQLNQTFCPARLSQNNPSFTRDLSSGPSLTYLQSRSVLTELVLCVLLALRHPFPTKAQGRSRYWWYWHAETDLSKEIAGQ